MLDDLEAHHQVESPVVERQGTDVACNELERRMRGARGGDRVEGNINTDGLGRSGCGEHRGAIANAAARVEDTSPPGGEAARPPVADEMLGLHELPSPVARHEALHRVADSVREIRFHRADRSGPSLPDCTQFSRSRRPSNIRVGFYPAVYDRVR